jgi:hypothetical protein
MRRKIEKTMSRPHNPAAVNFASISVDAPQYLESVGILSFGIFDNERVIQREFYGRTYQLGARFDY